MQCYLSNPAAHTAPEGMPTEAEAWSSFKSMHACQLGRDVVCAPSGSTHPHLEVCEHELECLSPLAVLVEHRQLDGVVANLTTHNTAAAAAAAAVSATALDQNAPSLHKPAALLAHSAHCAPGLQ